MGSYLHSLLQGVRVCEDQVNVMEVKASDSREGIIMLLNYEMLINYLSVSRAGMFCKEVIPFP